MRLIKLSEKAAEKYLSVISEERDKHWIAKWISYMIDSKYRTMVRLKNWIRDEMTNKELSHIVNVYRWKEIEDMDTRVMDIFKKIFYRTEYVTDTEQFGMIEKWVSPAKTWLSHKGDCEDFSLLILCLARLAGVPANRIRLVAGRVKGGIGHAWVRYIPTHYPFIAVYLDATWYPNANKIGTRKFYEDMHYPVKEYNPATKKWYTSKDYMDIWWGVNDIKEYGEYKEHIHE